MSIYEEIIALVESNFYRESGDYISWGSLDDSTNLKDAINDYLMNNINVVHYQVNAVDAFESPGYDTGVVYAAWVERNGSLHTIDYQWESM